MSAYTAEVGIEPGDVVDLEYQVAEGGKVIDRERNDFMIDKEQLIPGFYKGVLGMKVGETKEFTVTPEDGYISADNPLYGKYLDFNVTVYSIITNVRSDSVENTSDSPVQDTLDRVKSGKNETDDGTVNTSNLIESESIELPLGSFTFISSIFLFGFLRRRRTS